MEGISLLQSFALSKHGDLVSIADVARGQSCECLCPTCRTPMIAKQGEIRAWHFAHESGTDCPGGAESALHLAAKKVIEQAGGIMLPSLSITRTTLLPDGRSGAGEASLPASWIDFDSVQLEVRIGSVIPDVVGMTGKAMHLIEIGVSHFVDAEKLSTLQQIGLPAIEIDLSQYEQESWDWSELEQAIIQSTENKTWLYCPHLSYLEKLAAERAEQAALNHPLVQASIVPTSNRTRYRVGGRIVDLIDLPFGIALWSPYDSVFNLTIKEWARTLGGQYQPKFKNWLFPRAAQEHLIQKIETHPHQ